MQQLKWELKRCRVWSLLLQVKKCSEGNEMLMFMVLNVMTLVQWSAWLRRHSSLFPHNNLKNKVQIHSLSLQHGFPPLSNRKLSRAVCVLTLDHLAVSPMSNANRTVLQCSANPAIFKMLVPPTLNPPSPPPPSLISPHRLHCGRKHGGEGTHMNVL